MRLETVEPAWQPEWRVRMLKACRRRLCVQCAGALPAYGPPLPPCPHPLTPPPSLSRSLTWLGLTPAPMLRDGPDAQHDFRHRIPPCVLSLPNLQFLDVSGGCKGVGAPDCFLFVRGTEAGG